MGNPDPRKRRDTVIESRLALYQQDFDDRLRDARIRHRVDLSEQLITVRLTGADDVERAREVASRAPIRGERDLGVLQDVPVPRVLGRRNEPAFALARHPASR